MTNVTAIAEDGVNAFVFAFTPGGYLWNEPGITFGTPVPPTPAAVPEPGSILMMLSALGSIAGFKRLVGK